MESLYRLGIDLGGTKIEIVALDQNGHIKLRERVATPSGDYVGILNAVTNLIQQAEQALGIEPNNCTVGIGMPGALSRVTGKVKNSNSVCLNGQDFKHDLEERLTRSVRIENDANCLALSEAVDGAASDARIVFAVILGTGVGGGIVVDKQCLSGPNAITGEWGHNALPWPDHDEVLQSSLCYCGKKGCIETWLNGAGLSRCFADTDLNGLTAKAISEQIKRGNPTVIPPFENYCRRLAKSLASVINILDPEVIVLGGGLSNISALYERVPAIWSDYVFSDRVDTQLKQSVHGDSSGVRGSAWL